MPTSELLLEALAEFPGVPVECNDDDAVLCALVERAAGAVFH